MTDWIKHNGGPQPVGDDVWVQIEEVDYWTGDEIRHCVEGEASSIAFYWLTIDRYRILNQHLIDAALRRGIELGLDAAGIEAEEYVDRCRKEGHFDAAIAFATHANDLRALNPDTIAQEAQHD